MCVSVCVCGGGGDGVGGGVCTAQNAGLVPQPGIELLPPTVEVQSPHHWTAREVAVNIPF